MDFSKFRNATLVAAIVTGALTATAAQANEIHPNRMDQIVEAKGSNLYSEIKSTVAEQGIDGLTETKLGQGWPSSMLQFKADTDHLMEEAKAQVGERSSEAEAKVEILSKMIKSMESTNYSLSGSKILKNLEWGAEVGMTDTYEVTANEIRTAVDQMWELKGEYPQHEDMTLEGGEVKIGR